MQSVRRRASFKLGRVIMSACRQPEYGVRHNRHCIFAMIDARDGANRRAHLQTDQRCCHEPATTQAHILRATRELASRQEQKLHWLDTDEVRPAHIGKTKALRPIQKQIKWDLCCATGKKANEAH